MGATVTPEWLVMCESCSLVRRLHSAEDAAVMVLEHNHPGECPGEGLRIDKRSRVAS